MEDIDIINLWKTQDEKIERTLSINTQLLRNAMNQKAQTALLPLKRLKTIGIVAAFLWLIILGWSLAYAVSHYSPAANYFIISAAAIFIVNVKALSDYIRHLYIASNIDFDGKVVAIQEQLTRLQLSIIQHGKVMSLQIPFFTTFYLGGHWFPQNVGWGYLLFQLLLTGAAIYASYWLYINHTPENLDKKWFQKLLAGSGGKSVQNALRFYQDLDAFKR